MRTLSLVIISTAVAAAACTSDPTAADCDSGASVTGGVISGPTDQRVDKDLKVRGVAQHNGGLTIRRVLVAGLPASNDGFNFESWSATIPIDTLAGMTRTDGAAVTIEVVALDACARQFMLDSFTVEVDPTPGVRVESLMFD